MDFNINQSVKVRLTQGGKNLLQRKRAELLQGMDGKISANAWALPTEDADGWSEWQLWELMREFGQHIYVGQINPPFELTIRIPDREA